MKTLCICPIGIGNYIVAYPAFALLRKHRPDIDLHLLGLRNNIREWAAGDSLWSGVHVFDPTRMKGDVHEAIGIIRTLRHERFDASLSYFPSNKWQYNLLPVLAGIPKRYAFAYPLKGASSMAFLNTHSLAVNTALHDLWQNVALTGHFLGADLAGEKPVFPALYGTVEEQWANAYVKALGDSRFLLGMHPGSSADHGMDAKRWPPEHFARLGDLAAQQRGARVLILGGPEEASLKRQVVDSMRMPGAIADTPSLRHTAALITRCNLCVCNDSGLMHMSACMGVPTVGIFGPTDEKRNGPVGARALAIRKPMAGFPLWTAANVGRRAIPVGVDPMAPLRALTPEDAWSRIQAWLDEP